jgi:hypothetical protein
MATTPSPEQLDARLRSMLSVSEAGRREALKRLAERADEEEQSLLRVREKLAQKVGADDPRLQALDHRARGARVVSAFGGGTDVRPDPVADWVVKGRVVDSENQPVAGATIVLASADKELVRLFGKLETGPDGRFEARHKGRDFAAIFQRAPKANLVVTSPDGKLAHTTYEIQPKAGGTEDFEITLLASKPIKVATKKSAVKKEKGPA